SSAFGAQERLGVGVLAPQYGVSARGSRSAMRDGAVGDNRCGRPCVPAQQTPGGCAELGAVLLSSTQPTPQTSLPSSGRPIAYCPRCRSLPGARLSMPTAHQISILVGWVPSVVF